MGQWKPQNNCQAPRWPPPDDTSPPESLTPPHFMSNWGAACQARPSKPYIPPPWARSAHSARKAKLFPTHQDQAGVPRREHCPGWVFCKKTGLLVLPRLNSAPQSQPYTPKVQKGGVKKSTAKLSPLSPTGVVAENMEFSLPCLAWLRPHLARESAWVSAGREPHVQRGLQRPRASQVPEGKSTQLLPRRTPKPSLSPTHPSSLRPPSPFQLPQSPHDVP